MKRNQPISHCNLKIPHSRTDNPKRISRVVFCTSKEYEATVRARGGEKITLGKLAQLVEQLNVNQPVVSSNLIHSVINDKRKRP